MHDDTRRWGEAGWVALLAGATVLCSFAFACATPFAALATIAATRMPRRAGLLSVLLAFAGNQAIGFGLLHYPHTGNCYGWGAAIGVAALAGYCAASCVTRLGVRTLVGTLAAFALAFLGYEAALYLAGFALGSEGGAFAPRIVLRILEVNAGALAALLTLHGLGEALGWRSTSRGALAR